MALVHCTECDNEISSLAASCPKCGAPASAQPIAEAKKKANTLAQGVVGLLLIGGIAVWLLSSNEKPTPAPGPAAPVVAQPTVPTPPTPEEIAAQEREAKQIKNVMIVVNHIKKHLRNPDTLKWIVVKADDVGDIVCLSYRAQNGFGGMNIESAVVVGSKISHTPSNVKKYCADPKLQPVTELVEIMS